MREQSKKLGPSQNEGLIARVNFQADRVILTPAIGSNPEKLKKKIAQEKLFRQLTTNIPYLYHPQILKEDDQNAIYEIERAQGFNLTPNKTQIQGGGMTEFFKNVSTRNKAKSVITYLRTIDALNQAGYCFVDHKADSVFITPLKNQISIVDTDAIQKQEGGIWQRELQGGLDEILRAFFYRGMSLDNYYLIPATIARAIKNLEHYQSAHQLVTELEGWMKGEKIDNTWKTLGTDPKSFLILLNKNLRSDFIREKIEETDFTQATDYQIDILEAMIYQLMILQDGEPQSFDKFRLGIKS
jgi:hypothetical protein